MRLALEGAGEVVGFVGDASVEQAELFDLGFERGAVVALGFINGVHAKAEIRELLAEGVEEGLNLVFVEIGELGGFFLEEFGGGGLELELEGGLHLFDVGEVAGGALLLGLGLFAGGGEAGVAFGAVGGEGGDGVVGDGGTLGKLGGEGGVSGGEAGVFGGGGFELFVGAGGAGAGEEPSKSETGEKSEEEKRKFHVEGAGESEVKP